LEIALVELISKENKWTLQIISKKNMGSNWLFFGINCFVDFSKQWPIFEKALIFLFSHMCVDKKNWQSKNKQI
jgi:uncharacterized phage-like protein YoqJ